MKRTPSHCGLYVPIVTVLGMLMCIRVLLAQPAPWRVPLLALVVLGTTFPSLLLTATALPSIHAWSGGQGTPAWMETVQRWGTAAVPAALPLAHLLGCVTALLVLPPLIGVHPALGVFALAPWRCAVATVQGVMIALRRIAV